MQQRFKTGGKDSWWVAELQERSVEMPEFGETHSLGVAMRVHLLSHTTNQVLRESLQLEARCNISPLCLLHNGCLHGVGTADTCPHLKNTVSLVTEGAVDVGVELFSDCLPTPWRLICETAMVSLAPGRYY